MSRYRPNYSMQRPGQRPPPFMEPGTHDRFRPAPAFSRPATRKASSSPQLATPPPHADGDRPSPSEGETWDADFKTVQRYFGAFKMPATCDFEGKATPMSAQGGGVQQFFIARVDVPTPSGMTVTITAEGTSKKAARQNLFHRVRGRLETEGWLAAAEGSKRPRRDGGNQASGRHRPPQLRNQRLGAPEAWDSIPIKAIPSAQPTQPTSTRGNVPSAWDDDEDVGSWAAGRSQYPAPARETGRSTAEFSGSWGRVRNEGTQPLPSRQLPFQQQHQQQQQQSHSRPNQSVDPWEDSPSGQSSHEQRGSSLGQGVKSHWMDDLLFTEGMNSAGWRPTPQSSHLHRTPPKRGDHHGRPERLRSPRTQHHEEPEYFRPPPPPKAELPHDIDDAEKKLIAFYRTGNKLPNPKPVVRHIAAKRSEQNGKWEVRLRLPAHVFEGQQVNDILAVGHAKSKKIATIKAHSNLCEHILSIVSQQYVDAFRLHTMPFKTRVQQMLAEPIRIDLTESAVARLDNMLSQLKEVGAFQFQEPVVNDVTVEESLGLADSRLGQPPVPNFLNSGRKLHPSDVSIPRELEKNQLPIFTRYQEIISAIENNPVTVLSAETGAGKTTQLPQFILAHTKQQRSRMTEESYQPPANVVVTQPRRIAAISVAQRVAYERGEVIGKDSAIGYQVRFDDKRPMAHPREGSVVFCTSGILLRRLQEDPQLDKVTHIILDEVHERDLNTDLLLIITRQLLRKRPDLRLILMSATAETELFQRYFRGFGTLGPERLPPILNVAGRMFPVDQFFLEDVDQLLRGPRALPTPFRPTKESLHWVANETGSLIPPRGEDPVPYDYLEALIAHICSTRADGAILCFLPGWQEIDLLMQRLKDDDNFRIGFNNEERFRILPLHSSIPMNAQQVVFEEPPSGVRKIILSTNIAETSVTINDVVYVIDSGKLRMNSYDADRRVSSLNSVWASLSNLRQRTGRAGRCRPGLYFSLLSYRRKDTLPYAMPPELLRVDLQSTVLKIKALRLAKHVMDVFSAAPQPPSAVNITKALEELRALGALDMDENMTTLGRVLSNMPVDPWIGKMVLEAAMLGCLDPILTVAGGMEIGRGIFAIHPDEKDRGRAHILTHFAVGTESDHLTMLNAFRAWKKVWDENGGSFRNYVPAAKEFARANFLHHNSLSNIERARQQLLRVLEDSGLVEKRRRYGSDLAEPSDFMGGADYNTFANNVSMIRAVLCGALYPNVAEVTGKDEYRGRSDYGGRLRLTGSSVNSWKGVVTAGSGSEAANKISSGANSGRGTPAGSTATSDVGDYDYIPDDDDDSVSVDISTATTVPPLPPRLLSFQDKQKVNGGLYLRNTTRIDAITLFLFANNAHVAPTTVQTKNGSRPGLIVDGWIKMEVPSAQHMRVLMELKDWLRRYLRWVVWAKQRRAGGGTYVAQGEEAQIRSKWEMLGRMLVREVTSVVESGDKDSV